MNGNKKTQITFIEKFVSFCQKNDIWYAIDLNTLLNVHRHQTTVLHHHPFEVMMTFLSYNRLKRLAPNNVIDSFIDKKFKTLTSAYVENNQDWKKPSPFIQIRLVVPTTTKKVKQFNNPLYYWLEKIKSVEPNIKNAINFLTTSQHEGYIWLDRRFRKIDCNWAPVIDFTTTLVPFAHFQVAALKNSDFILEYWFGNDWKNSEKITVKHHNISPLQKLKVKQKKVALQIGQKGHYAN